jgi:prepilin-type N-terminal cleavage/methylation domain-containing protein/prepilin-type processing-associated H-X9-DG protein
MTTKNPLNSYRKGFTLMEVLVVIAIILVLAAIAVPTIGAFRMKAFKVQTGQLMKNLGSATQAYIGENNGDLPQEDSKGTDTWQAAADPENARAWYNAIPKQMGRRAVGDYVNTPREFYTKENLLFLQGATYPDDGQRMRKPLFPVAINTKLQRKDQDGKKPAAKLAQITSPSKTPLFLEQGLPGEKKDGGAATQKKSNFDGSPKGSPKSFVGRYGGKGFVLFVDGHVEEFKPDDLLTETGEIPWSPLGNTDLIWCRTPEEDPNKK